MKWTDHHRRTDGRSNGLTCSLAHPNVGQENDSCQFCIWWCFKQGTITNTPRAPFTKKHAFWRYSSCENSATLSHHLIDDGHYSVVIGGGSGFFRRRPTHVSILLIEWELILLVQTPKRRFMGKSTPARAANKTWPRSLLIRGSAYYYLRSYTIVSWWYYRGNKTA